MSISVMQEGETMGRHGMSPGIQSRIGDRLSRAGSEAPEAVVVLGAGPAGLLAAHAAALAGRSPVIFTAPDPTTGEPVKSEIGAATYLHSPIPDLTEPQPDAMVQFLKSGTASGYATKVYGDPRHPTSFDKFEGEAPAWNLRPVYDALWERYADNIVPQLITAEGVRDLVDSFPMIISTIPANWLCVGDHSFPSRKTWTLDGARWDQGICGDPIIWYDGRVGSDHGRFRASRIFGHESTEFSQPVEGGREGVKVQQTNCDCWIDSIVRAGRWGEWRPGVLVDDAFKKVWGLMFDAFEGA